MTTYRFRDRHTQQFEDHARQQVKYTTCYMCACRCGIKVTLENDRIRFIQGNRNHPVNEGVLCAKGSAGIMKQYSPAKLRKPLLRRPGTERGAGDFVEIEWDAALDMLTERLARIRATDPKKLAFFTGRDQMQALTGLWAQQFGTPNWAAHGGFCSVNMAAAGLYSIGFSFWEFAVPDWDNAKYFIMWGVAEDHSSNPIKIGLEKLKRHGAKFVSVNPVQTGYSAIADEWVPIRPGTDGLLALAIVHVLLSRELFDWEFLVRYSNAPWLVVQSPGEGGDGLFLRGDDGQPLVWDQTSGTFRSGLAPEIAPALFGEFTAPDGRKVKTVMSLVAERYLDARYAPESVARQCGVPAATIERIALEMAQVAFNEAIEVKADWTDCYGRTHDSFIGRPVAMYAMRGVSAHSNGFQSCRAIHLVQLLLGALSLSEAHPAAPGAREQRRRHQRAQHAADATAAGLSDLPRGSGDRQGRQAAADRQGLLVGIADRGSRAHAHGDRECRGGRPVPDRHPHPVHGQHDVEFEHEHAVGAEHAEGEGRRRRVQDSIPRGGRRLSFRNREFRRPRPAGHHVSRAARRHLAAGSPDLGSRLRVRCDPLPGSRFRPRRAAVAGGAGRPGVAPSVSRVRERGRIAQVRGLPGFHRQFRACARRRLSRRMAGAQRRPVPQRGTQSEAVGCLHRERVVLQLALAGQHEVHAIRQQGLSRFRGGGRFHRQGGADHHAALFRAPAEVPPGGTGPLRRSAAGRSRRQGAPGQVLRSPPRVGGRSRACGDAGG